MPILTKVKRRATKPNCLIQACIPRLKRLANDLRDAAKQQPEGTAEVSELLELSSRIRAFVAAYGVKS